MNRALLVLIAAAVLAFQCSQAQFSFSLPGNWGNGKRGFNFALPGRWGNVKRAGYGKCSDMDRETVFNIYRTIHQEADRIVNCLDEVEPNMVEKEKH